MQKLLVELEAETAPKNDAKQEPAPHDEVSTKEAA
jgi:hypothetical protein